MAFDTLNDSHQVLEEEALIFVRALQHKYLELRNIDQVLSYLSQHPSWIGTGKQEICTNLIEAITALNKEVEDYPGMIEIVSDRYHAQAISNSICLVYGTILAKPESPDIAVLSHRMSAIVQKNEEGMALIHLHLSHPDLDQQDNQYYVRKEVQQERIHLRDKVEEAERLLDEKNKALKTLSEEIPGGVYHCFYDENLTFISMSKSFQILAGYTEEEIKGKFNNHYLKMIHPSDRKTSKLEMERQLKLGDTVEIEYRLIHKSGKIIWILDQSRLIQNEKDRPMFYCMVMDITNQKRAREELRLSLERHQMILNQASDIIFEWDLKQDSLSFSNNWFKKFGYAPIDQSVTKNLLNSINIYEDDKLKFSQLMKVMIEGEPYSEAEIRLKNVTGNYVWNRIRATGQFDSDGYPIKVIGVILDISNEKKQQEELLELARQDALTGLYNKGAVRTLAEEKIGKTENGYHALMIIDVDHFKNINDNYGHLCGDKVLSEVANVLQSNFRSTDLVGRIGGDEFLVFMSDISELEVFTKRANQLLRELKEIIPQENADHVDCSIGVAVDSYDKADYMELFRKADQALYTKKNCGRGGICFYNIELIDQD